MTSPVRFPYVTRVPGPGQAGKAPFAPIGLTYRGTRVDAHGLLDTGSSVSILPLSVGLRLGADWSRQTTPVPLVGAFAGTQARALTLTGVVGPFPPVRLLFAWAATDAMPILLGQMDFFLKFDVCFYGSRSEFDISPATP